MDRIIVKNVINTNRYINTIDIRGNKFSQLNIPAVRRKLDVLGGVINGMYNNSIIHICFPDNKTLELFNDKEFEEIRQAINYMKMNYIAEVDLTVCNKIGHIKNLLQQSNIPYRYIGSQGEGEIIIAKPLCEEQVKVIESLNNLENKKFDVFILMEENNLLELLSICINESMYKDIVSYCDIQPDGSIYI